MKITTKKIKQDKKINTKTKKKRVRVGNLPNTHGFCDAGQGEIF
jgi:hypothetical protein